MARTGRPSLYKQEYCEKLIKHMASGLSFESFAAVIDVNRDTLFEWANTHLEFSDAKRRAYDKNLLWWEKQGTEALWTDPKGMQFNSTIWIFNMKNRHKWKDKHDVEMNATVQEIERQKLQAMPMSELTKLVKESLPKDENYEAS